MAPVGSDVVTATDYQREPFFSITEQRNQRCMLDLGLESVN
jgi:hypothetical protein